MKVGIVTVSDRTFAGETEDVSGPVIKEFIEGMGGIVVQHRLVPDEREEVASVLKELADACQVDIILTTGGTGFSPRDLTPEATEDVIERKAEGIVTAMLVKGLEQTPRAMLSRATAGIRGKTAIINLPGSSRAVAEHLEVLRPVLAHLVEVLSGKVNDCGRSK